MRKFVITGSFTGGIALVYNEAELLELCNLKEAELSAEQVKWVCRNLPPTIEDIMPFCDKAKLKAVEQDIEVTFEQFYEKYNNKTGKLKAQNAWKRLNKADQVKAYIHIGAYDRDLKINTWKNKMHPGTYLNQKPWED